MDSIQAIRAIQNLGGAQSIAPEVHAPTDAFTPDLTAKFSELMKRPDKNQLEPTDATPSAAKEHLDRVADTAIDSLGSSHDIGVPGATPNEQLNHTLEVAMQTAQSHIRLSAYAHVAKSTREGVQTLVKNQ